MAATNAGIRDSSLCSCNATNFVLISYMRSRTALVLVSSHRIALTLARVSHARNEKSLRLPIGVETSTRAGDAACCDPAEEGPVLGSEVIVSLVVGSPIFGWSVCGWSVFGTSTFGASVFG